MLVILNKVCIFVETFKNKVMENLLINKDYAEYLLELLTKALEEKNEQWSKMWFESLKESLESKIK